MEPTTELVQYLTIGGILFALGMLGFLLRRNMIVMFLCAEMMLQGISLSLVAWGRFHGDLGGQMLVIFIITVAACEAAIALALVLMLFHGSGKLDIAFWQNVREAGQPAFIDHEVPEERDAERAWPRLTTAGLSPTVDPEEEQHRRRV